MKIQEYYKDYANNKYSITLNKHAMHSNTVKDFYNDCIKQHLLDKDIVLAWHKMLLEYVNLPDAIFWIRQYESGSRDKITNRYNTRRACQTRFADGFSYVFVSNYDVHEIFNMISKGVVVTAREFLDLMKNHEFPLHYDNGDSHTCEEIDMAAYPHIGNVNGGVLTEKCWYLAHINSVNGKYLLNGKIIDLKADKQEKRKIFPRGEIADWKLDTASNVKIRNLSYSLSDDEKAIVKAHFLRFVDPLNYYLTPKNSSHISRIYGSKNINIGECEDLSLYVLEQYKKEYGCQETDDYQNIVLSAYKNKKPDENFILDIVYGKDVKKGTPVNAKSAPSIAKTIKLKSSPKEHMSLSKSSLDKKNDILNKIGKKYSYANQNEELFVNIIFYLNDHGLLTDNDFKMLTSEESKQLLGINRPVLAPSDNYDSARYLKKISLVHNGKEYVITNDWYPKDSTLEKIVAWAKSKGIN